MQVDARRVSWRIHVMNVRIGAQSAMPSVRSIRHIGNTAKRSEHSG